MQVTRQAEMFWMDALCSTLDACAALGPRRFAKPGLGAPLQSQVVDGGRVERRRFSSPEGSRLVRLFVPEQSPRGVVLMLHGCRQTSEDFARGTRFDRIGSGHRLLVAYPEQARAQNPLGCWQWFDPRNQKRGRGEPAILAGLVRALVEDFGLDACPVFAAGLSAGGAMAATLGTLYPDLFTAVGIHSGMPFGVAGDVASAFAAMAGNGGDASRPLRCPAIVFQGTADTTVDASNAVRLMRSFVREPRSRIRYRLTAGSAKGRRYSRFTLNSPCVPESEVWLVQQAGHAWFGGDEDASYADPLGPDASAEMLRFFLARAGAHCSAPTDGIQAAMRQAA